MSPAGFSEARSPTGKRPDVRARGGGGRSRPRRPRSLRGRAARAAGRALTAMAPAQRGRRPAGIGGL